MGAISCPQSTDGSALQFPGHASQHAPRPRVLCFGLQPEKSFPHVPTRSGETTLTVARVGDDPTCGMVAPWPFHEDTVTLRCEGRRLPETFSDEEAMRTALAHAPWVTITLQL